MSFEEHTSSSNPSSPCDEFEPFTESSSPPPCGDGPANHKNVLKSLQMKFTYLKEPRKRTRTTPDQLDVLLSFFDKQPCPSIKQRKQLAEKTGMTPRSIQVWFQNRRAKFRLSTPASAAPSKRSPTPTPTPAPSFSTSSSSSSEDSNKSSVVVPPYVPFQSFLKLQPVEEQQQQQPMDSPLSGQSPVSSPSSSSSYSSDESFDSFDGPSYEFAQAPFEFEGHFEEVKNIFEGFPCSEDFMMVKEEFDVTVF